MFDPYYTWLGIPPADQPADHYRLLGLTRFEANPDAISNAADRQMIYVRAVGQSRPREQSDVLSRLSAARVCLLDPVASRQYDYRLWGRPLIQKNTALGSRPPMPGPTKLDPVLADVAPQPRIHNDIVGPFIAIVVCVVLAACLVWTAP